MKASLEVVGEDGSWMLTDAGHWAFAASPSASGTWLSRGLQEKKQSMGQRDCIQRARRIYLGLCSQFLASEEAQHAPSQPTAVLSRISPSTA